MALNLRFAFVCQRKWSELTGDDPATRYCDSCDRTIVNLDPLTPLQRETLFRDAIKTGTKPCVFATIPVEGGNACGWEGDLEQMGGEPEMEEIMGLMVDED